MAKLNKRAAAIAAKIDRNKFYPVAEALALVKETATAKFDEFIDVAVQLGIDAKKSIQLVRVSVVLPSGPDETTDEPGAGDEGVRRCSMRWSQGYKTKTKH